MTPSGNDLIERLKARAQEWVLGSARRRDLEEAASRIKELEEIEDAALEIIGDAQEVEGSEGLSIVASLLIARVRHLIQGGRG